MTYTTAQIKVWTRPKCSPAQLHRRDQFACTKPVTQPSAVQSILTLWGMGTRHERPPENSTMVTAVTAMTVITGLAPVRLGTAASAQGQKTDLAPRYGAGTNRSVSLAPTANGGAWLRANEVSGGGRNNV